MNKASVIIIAILVAMSSKGQNVKLRPFQLSKPKQVAVFQGQPKSKVAPMAAASVPKQQLDSFVQERWGENANKFENSRKEQYAYDASGNMILSVSYDWNSSTNEWDGERKEEYAYDASGNMILDVLYYYRSSTKQWVGSSKDEYTYDSNSKITSKISSSWDANASQWYATSKHEYVYDNGGKNTLELFYNNSGVNSWSVYSKTENTYDPNGNKVSSVTYQFDSNTGQWSFNRKIEYTYDGKGNILQVLESQWGSGQWDLSTKKEYAYDASDGKGNILQELESQWRSGQWILSNKKEYAYDAIGHLTAETTYSFYSNTTQISSGFKTEVGYDANGNTILMAGYDWDSNANQWVAESKIEFEVDGNRLMKDVFSGNVFEKFGWVNVPLCANIYVPDGENWILGGKSVLHYSAADIPTGNKTQVSDVVSVFPNPASEYITLNVEKAEASYEFQLLDLQGRVVLSQPVRNNTPISVQQLPRGLYIYQVKGTDKTYTGKLVLK